MYCVRRCSYFSVDLYSCVYFVFLWAQTYEYHSLLLWMIWVYIFIDNTKMDFHPLIYWCNLTLHVVVFLYFEAYNGNTLAHNQKVALIAVSCNPFILCAISKREINWKYSINLCYTRVFDIDVMKWTRINFFRQKSVLFLNILSF